MLAPVGTIYDHKYLIKINGVEKTMNAWAKDAGLPFSTVKRRYQRGIRGQDLLKKGRLNSKKDDNQLSLDI